MHKNQPFDYEEIPTGYYDLVHERNSGMQAYWHRIKFENVGSVVSDTPSIRLLDFACGPGTFLGNYMRQSQGLGVDLAARQIQYARDKYRLSNLTFETFSIQELTERSETYQVATCIEFIEHISEEEVTALLQGIRKLLDQNGTLVITTPNYRGPWPVLEWCIDRFANGQVYDQQHITHWNRKRIREVLSLNGFTVNQIKGMHGIAPFFAPFSWKLARMISRIEAPIVRYSGLLLLAVATKSEDDK